MAYRNAAPLLQDDMIRLKGRPASRGIAAGPIFHYHKEEPRFKRTIVNDSEAETARLLTSLSAAEAALGRMRERAVAGAGKAEGDIFDAQLMFLKDATLLEMVGRSIREEHQNAESSWMDAIGLFAAKLDGLDSEYFRARATDIRDVGELVLRKLTGSLGPRLESLTTPSLVIAQDLAPSDTVMMDRHQVLAFCTAGGGPTSHSAILAKALGIPAVVGLGEALLEIRDSALGLVDGSTGELVVDPDLPTRREFEGRRSAMERQAESHLTRANEAAITTDHRLVEVSANVGSLEDAKVALSLGADGIGLLRTEFLYLNRASAAGEAEQLAIYDAILEVMGSRPVVIRTLDAGGDKDLQYLNLAREDNPFLGLRGIRLCLDRPGLFMTQVRALLRASPGHDLRIMFPMVSTLDEVREARKVVDAATDALRQEGYEVADRVQIGIMVEVPAVAIMADRFARAVDFFSIGTNDLTQYTLAAERTNEKVAHLGDACHPAVLKLVGQVIAAGHRANIWVGVCGELAGDEDALPILLGLGLDEFSMAPTLVPRAKAILRGCAFGELRQLATYVIDLESAQDVRNTVASWRAKSVESGATG